MKSRGNTTSSPASPHSRRETIPLVFCLPQGRRPRAPAFLCSPPPLRQLFTRDLNGDRFPWLQLVQVRFEDHPRNIDGGEQVGRQTKGQSHRKALHRTAAKK